LFSDDDEASQGNPLVAGFVDDLGSDDDVNTSSKVTLRNVGHAVDVSSDSDDDKPPVKSTSQQPFNNNTASSPNTFVTASQPNLNGPHSSYSQAIPVHQRNAAGTAVRTVVQAEVHSTVAESSDDDVAVSGQPVIKGFEDISGDEMTSPVVDQVRKVDHDVSFNFSQNRARLSDLLTEVLLL
jgi:hypothetical protein